jgi:endo-1,4-beta-xylanase
MQALTSLTPTATAADTVVSSVDFEDGTMGAWTTFGGPTVDYIPSPVDGNDTKVLSLTGLETWDGIQTATGLFKPGATYTFSAKARLAAGGLETARARLTLKLPTGETDDSGNAVIGYTSVTNQVDLSTTAWATITGTRAFTSAELADGAQVYTNVGTDSGGNYGEKWTVYWDDITITEVDQGDQPPKEIQKDITPIKDTFDFPVGIAIESTNTTGVDKDLVTYHYDQITPGNEMKYSYWYDSASTTWEEAQATFQMNPGAKAEMDLAVANDLRFYGHALVWHSDYQLPKWYYSDDAGEPLTNSAEDQAIFKERMKTHIFNVAKAISDQYGLFGSDTNPLVAFDVVNEVVDDSAQYEDGLRRSPFYNILGESYIDWAFECADEAFNELYADPSSDTPVTLFINDYSTEDANKLGRYQALIERLIDRGVPVGGVGHQFHTNIEVSISNFERALHAFDDLPVVQAITEFDANITGEVNEASLLDQGYFYRDVFDMLREYNAGPGTIFSATIWGTIDTASWLRTQTPGDPDAPPLPFDGDYQAKPAYYGMTDQPLPEPIRSGTVYRGQVSLDEAGATSDVWDRLSGKMIGDSAAFDAYWWDDALWVEVQVLDETVDNADQVELIVNGQSFVISRSDPEFDAVVVETQFEGAGSGYAMLVKVPMALAAGDVVDFAAIVTDNGQELGHWGNQTSPGLLTMLADELPFLAIPAACAAPAIDGSQDDAAWATAGKVETAKAVQGEDAATAETYATWSDDTLYLLMDVTDSTIDLTPANSYEQDSVEIYVDRGNIKNGDYLASDSHLRINADNQATFDQGEADGARLKSSATSRTDHGYIVEMAIALEGSGVEDGYLGLDVQVNDATDGARTGLRNWADPTGQGYLSTARWGVGQLVANPACAPAPTPEPSDDATTPAPGASAQTGGQLAGGSAEALALAGLLLVAGLAAVTARRRLN